MRKIRKKFIFFRVVFFALSIHFYSLNSFAQNTNKNIALGLTLTKEDELIKIRQLQIKQVNGNDIESILKKLQTNLSDIGFYKFSSGIHTDEFNHVVMHYGTATGDQYKIYFYIRKQKNINILRVLLSYNMDKSSPPIAPPVKSTQYEALWNKFGTSDFVSKLELNPKEIH